jgi:hypothetical protein
VDGRHCAEAAQAGMTAAEGGDGDRTGLRLYGAVRLAHTRKPCASLDFGPGFKVSELDNPVNSARRAGVRACTGARADVSV